MSDMEELLRQVIGKAVRTNFSGNTAKAYESLYFNSLRESGLLRLLEAGQDLFNNTSCSCVHMPAVYPCPRCKLAVDEWSATLTEVKKRQALEFGL